MNILPLTEGSSLHVTKHTFSGTPERHAQEGVQRILQHDMGPAGFVDLYEFDPEVTQKAPFRVRVRTTLPFLGSRFESVRTITISDEIPGVSCRHTLTGYVRVRWRTETRYSSATFTVEIVTQAVHAHPWIARMLASLQLTCCVVDVSFAAC